MTEVDAATPDPAVDGAAPVGAPLFIASGPSLYKVDLDGQQDTLIGTVTRSGTEIAQLDGLGFDGANVIGLDAGGGTLLVIDPTTAVVSASKTLDVADLGGLTVIRPGDSGNAAPMFLAAKATGLYQIEPLSGHVSLVGTFSTGYSFASDLAWVHGHGLYVTLTDGMNTRAVQINPQTAKTIAAFPTGFDNVNGLSGYRDALWAVSTGGFVYSVNLTTGMLTMKMSGGPEWTEAAQ